MILHMDERVREESALHRAVLAGDASAWRALYDRAYADLWAYLLWRCAGLSDLAEEIMQETWLVAVRRIRTFDPAQGPFLAWLRGIAGNLLQNHFRAARRGRAQQLSGEEAALDATVRRDEAEAIARALAELAERYEAVLRAKYLDLKSVDDIARETSQSSKTIESLLTRAREAFRVAYEKLAGAEFFVKDRQP